MIFGKAYLDKDDNQKTFPIRATTVDIDKFFIGGKIVSQMIELGYITKKEKGYRMYNNVLMDYTIVKLESLKDMRKFTDVLKTQLETFNQAI